MIRHRALGALLAGAACAPATAAAANAAPLDGTVWAAYGSRPTIHGRPFFVTDLVLAPGERITTIAIGDAARWRLGRGISGARGATEHVFVKPSTDANATNLDVLTDRRVYDVQLVNDGRAYTAHVAFYEPPHAAHRSARRQTPTADARPALPPARPRRQASRASSRSHFFRDYLVLGADARTMNVSHTMDRTYVSVGRALRDRLVAFTADAAGRRFLPIVRRRGATYELREVPARLYVWADGARCAAAQRWAP